MEIEEAIELFAGYIAFCEEYHQEVDLRADKIAVQAMEEKARQRKNPPLTLEELLDLAGKEPVYAVSDFDQKGNWCVLGTARRLSGEKTLVAIYGRNLTLSGEDYGDSWIAYRRKPEETVTNRNDLRRKPEED